MLRPVRGSVQTDSPLLCASLMRRVFSRGSGKNSRERCKTSSMTPTFCRQSSGSSRPSRTITMSLLLGVRLSMEIAHAWALGRDVTLNPSRYAVDGRA